MLILTGENITIVNEDTMSLEVTMTNYIFQEGDRMFFTVRKSAGDEEALIDKEITIFSGASGEINLSSADTNLPPATYVYDVQLSLADGTVDTVIGPANFTVIQGVTHKL